ncbi:hypothetical protein CUB78_06740 [Prochlorococcus marinus str. XMU1401]|uniref:Uncharacterized protein n=1 Tax=Prochlorococcus marinus str. XMU1401 TaxID=2052594 RepID=A0A8I1X332_PROMR|nr:hypothetical protein [Prochlorococcus marinus]MBO8223299.1 hypothetical protein [Prochlorococcus marinus str. XMU1401]MBW3059832.1 hypothetical protein [Prochlorococcus marinus str. XMU1401E]MCQ9198943.1 hypothetical protein [Prochlorococcus marinus XMU1429]PJC83645.1 hypothetical protein CUB78_06740 [Prochlorococcus marinus str. XMU1401]
MNKEKSYIFLVFSPIIDILVSRIIFDLIESKSISKKSILIIHPKEYKPTLVYDIKKICFDESAKNESNIKDQSNKNLNLKVQYFLYLFRRYFNSFGKRVYGRLGKLPVSLWKISAYYSFIRMLNLKNKETIVYTPNVKVHIFQILIFYTRNFQYHLLEEGSGSFKSLNETEQLFTFDAKLLIADLISAIILNCVIIIRLIYDSIKIFILKGQIPIKLVSQYLRTPIFSGGMFFLNKIKPLTLNRITEEAFSSFEFIDKFLFNKESNYELIKKRKINQLINNLKIKNISIFILPGDNINILKREFDNKKTNIINQNNIIIRPHPRLSRYSIKTLAEILDINIAEENILISEKLRLIPVELLFNIKGIKFVFTGVQKSSLLLYFKKAKINFSIV